MSGSIADQMRENIRRLEINRQVFMRNMEYNRKYLWGDMSASHIYTELTLEQQILTENDIKDSDMERLSAIAILKDEWRDTALDETITGVYRHKRWTPKI